MDNYNENSLFEERRKLQEEQKQIHLKRTQLIMELIQLQRKEDLLQKKENNLLKEEVALQEKERIGKEYQGLIYQKLYDQEKVSIDMAVKTLQRYIKSDC